MAKFYGKSSGYLLKNDLGNFFLGVSLVLLPLFLVWFSLEFFEPEVTAVVSLVALVFVLVLSTPFVSFFKRKSGRFFRGRSGERKIRKELSELPDEFSVYPDLQLGKGKGNLDFVVVGPPGIFNVEVKSYGGTVDYNGYALTLNGREFRDKNLLRQVHGQTWALKKYLKQATGADVYIHSVMVFSNDRANIHLGSKPVENVYIVQKSYLLNAFDIVTKPLTNRQAIESALKKLG